MFTGKSFLGQISALGIALENEKAKSLPIRREVKIVNEQRLHARPAAEFVRAAHLAGGSRRAHTLERTEVKCRVG
jgi:PTS HPr component phosphorylation site